MENITQIKLTKKQARQFILLHQRLLPPRQLKTKQDIVDFIAQVGCIQFDPLDRVGHNPQLVLQARFDDYAQQMLSELLYEDRKLLDAWDKNMSIYSVQDRPYFSRNRERAYKKYRDKAELFNEVIPAVREIIVEKGPVSSIDLDFDKKVDWSWAPTRAARAALESMYSWGELIIHHKVGTRKVYDFAEKHLPAKLLSRPDPNPMQEEYYRWYVKRRIGSVGMLWPLSGGAWLGIKGLKKQDRLAALSYLEEDGEIISLAVEGVKHPFYILEEEVDLIQEILSGISSNSEAAFIAPLDNLLWDRKLIKRIFDFEYVWEVYKPVSERRYGYYVLPVLYGDRFVARFEPVFAKERRELIVENWWWEEGVSLTPELKDALITCFEEFLNYLGGETIKVKDEGLSRLLESNWQKQLFGRRKGKQD